MEQELIRESLIGFFDNLAALLAIDLAAVLDLEVVFGFARLQLLAPFDLLVHIGHVKAHFTRKMRIAKGSGRVRSTHLQRRLK